MDDVIYRPIEAQELAVPLLMGFSRFQRVERCWRKTDEGWRLKFISFIERWGLEDYEALVVHMRATLEGGGTVLGAFWEGRLVGFAAVEGTPLGTGDAYRQLALLHVSKQSRGRGIGAALLKLAARWGREQGAEKLYISSHSAQETVAFYWQAGCREARWRCPHLVELEPFDVQLELDLSNE